MLADDSGICAEALAGAPGIYSARFAGEGASDEANLAKLLAEVGPGDDRRVAYVAELVAIDPAGGEHHARGELRGTLALEPRGDGGFGYDPAFIPEGESRTVAELGAGREGRDLPPRPRRRGAAARARRGLTAAVQARPTGSSVPIGASAAASRARFRPTAYHQLISAPMTMMFAIRYSHTSRITRPPNVRSAIS